MKKYELSYSSDYIKNRKHIFYLDYNILGENILNRIGTYDSKTDKFTLYQPLENDFITISHITSFVEWCKSKVKDQ